MSAADDLYTALLVERHRAFEAAQSEARIAAAVARAHASATARRP